MHRCRDACAVLFSALILLSTPFSADAAWRDRDRERNRENRSDTVELTIRAGDARALANCLNLTKVEVRDYRRHGDWGGYRGRWKNWDDYWTSQENDCDNKAQAAGGDVILKNVEILVVQNDRLGRRGSSDDNNTINITFQAGNATAVATCLNAVREGGNARVAQDNDCQNNAVAYGGDVIIKNVEITVIQKDRA
jgi:hypothetical protein